MNALLSRSRLFITGEAGSCWGTGIDVVAPGNYLYVLNNEQDTFGYNVAGGTSLATAVVSGIATLILSCRNDLDPAAVARVISSTAADTIGPRDEDTPGWDRFYGFGMVNAARALREAQNAPVRWTGRRAPLTVSRTSM
jgi:thermitase